MKKITFLAAALAFLAACQNVPKADNATTGEQQAVANAAGTALTIDTTNSVVRWLGTKPVGQHEGTLKIANGNLTVDGNTLAAGTFVIDIKSLTDTDLKPGEGKEKLEGHLKSPDFFDVAKFPTARFEITNVEVVANDSTATHKISGNLTLKDSTKNVTFPAKINITDNSVAATANFNIDRTQWGLFYGSDKSLGDKFIRPEVNLKLDIKANK